MDDMLPHKSFIGLSFIKRFLGVFLAKRAVFRDIAEHPRWIETLLLYLVSFGVKFGLLIFFFKVYWGEVAGSIIGTVWNILLFLLFLVLIIWLLCIVIYHGICKLGKGRAIIASALSLGAFLYAATTPLFLFMILLWLVILQQAFWLLAILELFMFFMLIWGIVIAVKGFSTIHEISSGKSFGFFLIVLVIASFLCILTYMGLSAYLSGLLLGAV